MPSTEPIVRVLASRAGGLGRWIEGVSPRSINDGDYARPLSDAEISELIGLIGIPWPPSVERR